MSLSIDELKSRIEELNAAGLVQAARALERELSFQLKKAA